ncbi:cache domain-containing protein [Patescibacteria group bacterium]|nr:cache domain-containing protein [Patescibacteria group bacterium]
MKNKFAIIVVLIVAALAAYTLMYGPFSKKVDQPTEQPAVTDNYKYQETKDLVALVQDAVKLVEEKGEDSFTDFETPGSKWLNEDMYVFVLDEEGNMVFHVDPKLKEENQINLKDSSGKPIVKWFLQEALEYEKGEGWTHYQWPKPDTAIEEWKTTYVKKAQAPSGKNYVVGSGIYNAKMEKQFLVDEVKDAAELLETEGLAAFDKLRDPAGEFIYKDTYVFVSNMDGVELVNPAFPELEGQNITDLQDINGKYLQQAIQDSVKDTEEGWADYMWPKPGATESTLKNSYIRKVKVGEEYYIVGSGSYLE